MFGHFSLVILGIVLIGSVVILALERAAVGVKRGTAGKLFKAVVVGIIIIFIVPEIWDPIAITTQLLLFIC
ncbi:MAG: hypothetical protein HRO68_10130 [Nitrosopumilus sp.]|nr:hypothetical protein [Nitrosopumilus sp.]